MWHPLLSLAGTIGAYLIARAVCKRLNHWWANPFFIGTALVVAGLAWTKLSYLEYREGVQPLVFLLGPATVALGIPLARNLPLLRRNLAPVLWGGTVGAVVGVALVVVLASFFGMSKVLLLALVPKSVTTPVAVAISEFIGGDGSLTAAMVTITGFSGVLFARPLLDVVGIRSPVARGLAFGVGIHGTGVVEALEESELTAAMAGLGLTVSAIFTGLVAPALLWFLP